MLKTAKSLSLNQSRDGKSSVIPIAQFCHDQIVVMGQEKYFGQYCYFERCSYANVKTANPV